MNDSFKHFADQCISLRMSLRLVLFVFLHKVHRRRKARDNVSLSVPPAYLRKSRTSDEMRLGYSPLLCITWQWKKYKISWKKMGYIVAVRKVHSNTLQNYCFLMIWATHHRGWMLQCFCCKNMAFRKKTKKFYIFYAKYLVIWKKSSTFAPTNLPRFPQDQRA